MAEKEVMWHNISVDVGWGNMSGKTCVVGNAACMNSIKILGVHGWLDNANTFDNLVPCLPNGVEVLVFDLPGHGLSDHLPHGLHYDLMLYTLQLKRAVDVYGWDSFILLGHSMGAGVSNFFAALFPECVIALISLDFIRPHPCSPNVMQEYILIWRKAEQSQNQNPLVYTEREVVERMMNGRKVLTPSPELEDAVHLLLPRSARQVAGGYIWTHDPRARVNFHRMLSGDLWLLCTSTIKCPVLIIMASGGIFKKMSEHLEASLNVYRSNARWFDVVTVEGHHHVHLTHAERVGPPVSKFLLKFTGNEPKLRINAKL